MERSELTLEYIRFQKSDKTIVEYCKEKNIPYLEFVEEVNRWDKHYGIQRVEGCMQRHEKAGKWSEKNKYLPSIAQNAFKELVIEPDVKKCRSHTKFPEDPSIYVELEDPIPGTIVHESTITFPSGVCLTMYQSTIKSLILAVILYEEHGLGVE